MISENFSLERPSWELPESERFRSDCSQITVRRLAWKVEWHYGKGATAVSGIR
jgi:hypothetical protein